MLQVGFIVVLGLNFGLVCSLVDFLPGDDSLIVDEYKSAQYVIAVDKSGKQFRQTIPAGKRESRAYGLEGYEYQCLLLDDVVGSNGTEKELSDEKNVPDPYEIVNSQLHKKCLYRREQWWIYQYCHKVHVRQYHEEHEVLMSEYFLGKYNQQQVLNWTEVLQNQNTSLQGSNAGDSTRYVSLLYDQGELCDLTGKPRQTEIRFVCRPDLPDKNSIISIKEPATCQYIFTVAMPALCSHPDFEVQSPHVHHILCSVVPGSGSGQLQQDETTMLSKQSQDDSQSEVDYIKKKEKVHEDDDDDDEDEYLDYEEEEEEEEEDEQINSKEKQKVKNQNQNMHDEL